MLGISSAISALNMRRMSENIDDELRARGRQMLRPMGQPGGPGTMPPNRGGPPPVGQGSGAPIRFGDEEADLIGSIRRPRWLNLQGAPMNGGPNESSFDPVGFSRAKLGRQSLTETDFRGLRIRVLSLPVVLDGQVVQVVQIARELRDFMEVRRIQGETLLVFLPLGLLASISVAWFLTGRVVRPIAQMARSAHAFGAGELSTRIAIQGDDEFADLGREFNQMADKVQGSISRLEATLEQQRRFTADASHELRTPLTRILMATSLALESGKEFESAVKTADTAARDMSRVSKQLLDLALLDATDLSATFVITDLRLVVSGALDKASGGAPDVSFPEVETLVLGDPELLERAVINLLENAFRYGASSRPVSVGLTMDNGFAVLQVRDFGAGVAEDVLGHLTERFYRAENSRSSETGGTGLGLAIVKEIVLAHDGVLHLSSPEGGGLCAEIRLRLAKV